MLRLLTFLLLITSLVSQAQEKKVIEGMPIQDIMTFNSLEEACDSVIGCPDQLELAKAEKLFGVITRGTYRLGVMVHIGDGWEVWPLVDEHHYQLSEVKITDLRKDGSLYRVTFSTSWGGGHGNETRSAIENISCIIDIQKKLELLEYISYNESYTILLRDSETQGEETTDTINSINFSQTIDMENGMLKIREPEGSLPANIEKQHLAPGLYDYKKGSLIGRP